MALGFLQSMASLHVAKKVKKTHLSSRGNHRTSGKKKTRATLEVEETDTTLALPEKGPKISTNISKELDHINKTIEKSHVNLQLRLQVCETHLSYLRSALENKGASPSTVTIMPMLPPPISTSSIRAPPPVPQRPSQYGFLEELKSKVSQRKSSADAKSIESTAQ